MRRVTTRGASIVVLSAAAVACPSSARAQDKQACIRLAEQADDLRRETRTHPMAREKLRACAAEPCPAMIRSDCAQWLAELEQAMPSVVLVAREEGSAKPLANIRQLVDGVAISDAEARKSLPVEAGPHSFMFVHAGRAIEVKKTIGEGEKNVEVLAVFPRSALVAPARRQGSSEGDQDGGGGATDPQRGSTMRVAGIVVAVAGVVSLGVGSTLGLLAMKQQEDARCPDNRCGDGSDPDALRSAKSSANAATGFFIAGGALLASGIGLYLFAPSPGAGGSTRLPSASRMRIVPTSNANGGGLMIAGSWF